MMLLPTFLSIGAPKCGTTWLYNSLHEHPDVYIPAKEMHFFLKDEGDLFATKGVSWYASRYANARPEQARGDISVFYMREPYVPQRIKQVLPDCKMIALLRNPITRAYSHYRMFLGRGRLTHSFEEIVLHRQDDRHQILRTGLYAEQLSRYFEIFPQENFYTVLLEDIKQQPEVVLQQIFDFIGVDSSFQSALTHGRSNEASFLRMPKVQHVKYKISRFLMMNNLNWIRKLIKATKLPNLLWQYNQVKRQDSGELSKEVWMALVEYYQKDVETLSQILGRNLAYWLDSNTAK